MRPSSMTSYQLRSGREIVLLEEGIKLCNTWKGEGYSVEGPYLFLLRFKGEKRSYRLRIAEGLNGLLGDF